jgi:hypothetical protein
MSSVAVRNQYSYLYGPDMLPVLEELFRSELEMHPSRREQLFKIVSHDRDIWQSAELSDMELFQEVPENTEYSFKRSKQGSSKTLTMVKFGLGFSVSEEMVDDGKFDLIADMTRKLAESARESQEIQAMNVFNNGFSSELAWDGLSVFNSAHLAGPSGLTFRNRLAVDADLSTTSLDTALSDFETQQIGDSGIIKNVPAKILLVHPSQKRYAMEIVGSELKADTANNNMNSLKSEGLQVISSPHLTDPDAWFLCSAPGRSGLRIINRSPIQTKAGDPAVGFATDSILYKARYREKIGVTHPYGIFGSPGA